MNAIDLKISTKLTLLSAFLILCTFLVAVTGWQAISRSNARLMNISHSASEFQHAVDQARQSQVIFKIQIQEWKNILIRGAEPAQFEKYRNAFVKNSHETQKVLAQLVDTLQGLAIATPLLAEARVAIADLEPQYLHALKQFNASADGAQAVDGQVAGMDRLPTQKIDEIVAFVMDVSERTMARNVADAAAQYEKTVFILMLVFGVSSLTGAGLAYWISKSVTRPINAAVKIAETVASGDLSTPITVQGSGEIAKLMLALSHMSDSLVHIVTQVRTGTEAISTGSAQIASGNLDLSARTEEQASSLTETASSMEQLTSTVKQNADNADQASQLAAAASETATKGGTIVAHVTSTMEAISASSNKIVDIISVIDTIAFQTNILALNAAVEAARAGEEGRGFAVVASEVRGLAQRSAAAAKEIKTLIEQSVVHVDSGTAFVAQASSAMVSIVDSVKQVTDIMGEIAAASQEQSAGIEQVNRAVGQMDEVTQHNATLVEEAAAASESLREQANALAQVVSVFRLQADQHTHASLAY